MAGRASSPAAGAVLQEASPQPRAFDPEEKNLIHAKDDVDAVDEANESLLSLKKALGIEDEVPPCVAWCGFVGGAKTSCFWLLARGKDCRYRKSYSSAAAPVLFSLVVYLTALGAVMVSALCKRK